MLGARGFCECVFGEAPGHRSTLCIEADIEKLFCIVQANGASFEGEEDHVVNNSRFSLRL